MKEADAERDAVFNGLTDADAMKMINAGRGGQRLEQAVLQGAVLEHSQEMYGYMAVYLRLKSIVCRRQATGTNARLSGAASRPGEGTRHRAGPKAGAG